MATAQGLNDDFEVTNRISFTNLGGKAENSVAAVMRVPLDGSLDAKTALTDATSVSCTVSLFGATAVSFKEGNTEMLYLSPTAVLDGSKPVRGGIPICWPQFSDMGPLSKHGFVRDRSWRVSSARSSKLSDGSECAKLTLSLDVGASDGGLGEPVEGWPHAAELTAVFVLSARPSTLTVQLQVTNTGPSSFSFTAALHTYLRVADCQNILIPRLRSTQYMDNLNERNQVVEKDDIVSIDKEVDRIYLKPPNPLLLRDPGRQREVTIRATGLPDAVIWNPWIEKAKTLSDFPDQDYLNMVCMESARVGDAPRISPKETWTGSVTYEAVHRR